MDYREMMGRLIGEGKWDDISALFVEQSKLPDPSSLVNVIAAYIKAGVEAGYDHNTLQSKLSAEAVDVLRIITEYLAKSLFAKRLTEALFGGKAAHEATPEVCQQCTKPDCETRLAEFVSEKVSERGMAGGHFVN
jgi:hypothetical protein